MKFLVLSCSLNPASRSRELARVAHTHVEAQGVEVEFLDLATLTLPLCDGGKAYSAPEVAPTAAKIRNADGILVAAPVYNYDVNAAAKNLLELTGSSWRGKVVGFITAAGGHGSYMSILSFANSLMLDFRCFILPRFVYLHDAHADDVDFGDAAIAKRLEELAAELVRVTKALSTA